MSGRELLTEAETAPGDSLDRGEFRGGMGTRTRTEDFHLRNYDWDRSYRVTLTVRDDDGIRFKGSYDLSPGAAVSEHRRLRPGRYDVTVETDDDRATATCNVGDGTPGVVVETGNGVVSVS